MYFPDSWFEDEVRNGFYVPAMMKRAWAANLEVLADVAEVCDKHHIRWFADFGTLLGAVRHSGFIPWDDDIDICMFRNDYIRFNQIAQEELPKGYYIPQNRPDGHRLHTPVWNGNSICLEKQHLEKYHGFPFVAGIDVFPLNYVPAEPKDRELHKGLVRNAYHAAVSIHDDNQDTAEMNDLVTEVENLFHISLDKSGSLKDQLYSLVENTFSLYTEDEAKEAAHASWFLANLPRKYPLECFSSSVMLPFEGTQLPAPAGYDMILKTQFGDYMKYCRAGNSHNYPFYSVAEKLLAQTTDTGRLPYQYLFSKNDLSKAKAANQISPEHLIRDFLQLADMAHREILNAAKRKDFHPARELLGACQNSAIQIGSLLEQSGESTSSVVGLLEEYCELTYQIHEELAKYEQK